MLVLKSVFWLTATSRVVFKVSLATSKFISDVMVKELFKSA